MKILNINGNHVELEYNKELMKYKVNVTNKNITKWVVRLSIMFLSEDETLFKERIEQCKNLQSDSENEYRLRKYVENISIHNVSPLTKEIKARIFNRVVENNTRVDAWNWTESFLSLKKEMEDSYILNQKKYMVLNEMKDPKNHSKFTKEKIPIKIKTEDVPD